MLRHMILYRWRQDVAKAYPISGVVLPRPPDNWLDQYHPLNHVDLYSECQTPQNVVFGSTRGGLCERAV